MLEELLFTLLGLLFAFQVGMMLTLRRCEALLHTFNGGSSFDPGATVEELKDEMGQIIEDLMGSMRTPTIADHLGGVISQFAQVRLMKMMQQEGLMADQPAELMSEVD